MIPAFTRAWVEFLDERALENPKIQKNLHIFSGEQIFAHIQVQVAKSGCLFSFLLTIPHFYSDTVLKKKEDCREARFSTS